MSELQPGQQYASYPRGQIAAGDPDRLEALGEGYYGLVWPLLASFAAFILAIWLMDSAGPLGCVLLLLAVVGVGTLSSYPSIRKASYGAGWSRSTASMVAVLVGFGSLGAGMLGIMCVMSVFAGKIRDFGVRGGKWDFRKRDIDAAVAMLRSRAEPPAALTD